MAIELVTTPGPPALRAELADEVFAYVDGDVVVPELPGRVPALLVRARSVRWDGGPEVELPPGMAPDRAALLAFAGVAREAAGAVDGRGPIEVIGKGVVAAMVRRLAPAASADGSSDGGSPAAIVDTTGDPATLAAAARRLADLGTLVLAGEPLGRRLSVDLYPDVHRRGLRLVGVAPPVTDPMVLLHPADVGVVEPPLPITTGTPLPSAAWYRLSPDGIDRLPSWAHAAT
jgi:hypothetical protein